MAQQTDGKLLSMTKSTKGFGPIHLVIACLVASAVLRLGSDGMALAETGHAAQMEMPDLPTEVAQCEALEDVDQLIRIVKERETQLDEKSVEITNRQLILENLEDRIKAQIVELETANQNLAETLAIADGAAETDLNRLTTVYEAMKPQNAARVFENMDLTFAAGFLSRMDPQSAAMVMSELPAELAYSVSVVMAGQNARAPTE